MPVEIIPDGDDSGPERLVDRCADAAFRAVSTLAQAEGRAVQSCFIALTLVPDESDPIDATVAGTGFEDGADVFASMVAHTVSAGKELGLTVLVAPLGQG